MLESIAETWSEMTHNYFPRPILHDQRNNCDCVGQVQFIKSYFKQMWAQQ